MELPLVVEELTELVGVEKALAIVDAFGGTPCYVPKQIPADHRLATLVGTEDAAALSERWGGDFLRVPRCAELLRELRNKRVRDEHAAGMSAAKLARKHGLTDRHIFRILAGEPVELDAQLELFAPKKPTP